MLDHITALVLGFFFGYIVMYYTRPSFVLVFRKDSHVISHDKLFLSSVMVGLLAVLVNIVAE